MIGIACVNGGAAGAYFGVEFLGQFEQHIEVFAAAHAIATGNDDRCAFQIVFGLFYMAVDDFYYIVRFGNIVGYIMFDDFTFIVSIQNFFLHHALAYGCHLRAVFGVHNRCHDVTAECGTDLVQ